MHLALLVQCSRSLQECPLGTEQSPNFNKRNHIVTTGDLNSPAPLKPTHCSELCVHGYAKLITCYAGDTDQAFLSGQTKNIPQNCEIVQHTRSIFDEICGVTESMLRNGCISGNFKDCLVFGVSQPRWFCCFAEAELAAIRNAPDYRTTTILRLDGSGEDNPWNRSSFDGNGDVVSENEDSWLNVVTGTLIPGTALTFSQSRKQLCRSKD